MSPVVSLAQQSGTQSMLSRCLPNEMMKRGVLLGRTEKFLSVSSHAHSVPQSLCSMEPMPQFPHLE